MPCRDQGDGPRQLLSNYRDTIHSAMEYIVQILLDFCHTNNKKMDTTVSVWEGRPPFLARKLLLSIKFPLSLWDTSGKKKKKNSGKYGQCTPSLFFMNPDCTLEYVGVVYIRGYGRDVASVLHTQHVLVSANNDEK